MNVSTFTTHLNKELAGTSTILGYLENVRNGQWQDLVIKARLAYHDKDVYKALKAKLGGIMPHGQFLEPTTAAFTSHSGYVCLDIDHLDEPPSDYEGSSYQEYVEARLKADPYTYALHRSLSGFGVCVWVRPSKINGDNHTWAYKQIALYYGEKYGLLLDFNAGALAKRRAWSYDPDLYHNPQAEKFTIKVEPKQPPREIKVAFSDSDMDNLVRDIRQRGINLVSSYQSWIEIGFALSEGLGEAGRDYFHIVSQNDTKYKPTQTDRQYNYCLRGQNGKKVTLGTFFHRCKEAGLTITSERTQRITTLVMQGKRNGNTVRTIKQDVAKVLSEEPTESDLKLIDDAMLLPDNSGTGLDLDEQLRIYLNNNYTIKYNQVLSQVEVDGLPINDIKFNSMWLAVRKTVSDKVTRDVLRAMLNSDTFTLYHPIQDYLFTLPIATPNGENELGPTMPLTRQLAASIGATDPDEIDWIYYFILRWGVGMMYQAFGTYGKPNTLCPILSGPINSGKTSWIRQLMPDALRPYVTQLEAGAKELDRAFQFATSILCYDDEGLGHTVKSNQQFKAEMSKTTITGRGAYKEFAETRPRLASMAMTTNESEFLNDPSGNRRAIPIHVEAVNWDIYNAIDKVVLLSEWYSLYLQGWDFQLSDAGIAYLNEVDKDFRIHTDEDNLIDVYLEPAALKDHDRVIVNATTLLVVLAPAGGVVRMTSKMLGMKLKAKGFLRYGSSKWVVRFKIDNMRDQYNHLVGFIAPTVEDKF
jgi:predicted P-loop ATPase